jgi:translation initiation factor 3 subunit C
MSSRFFAGGQSDSEYSSSEEEFLSSSEEEELNSSSEEEEQDQEDELSEDSEFANASEDESDSDSDDDGRPKGPSYFLKKSFGKNESDSDSDDEDDKKVVKSAKDKLLDEIENSISDIENSSVVDDWIVVLSEFDKVQRLLIRAQQQSIPTPKVFIAALSNLDERISNFSPEAKKKLNASVSKAFNTVRQRVKKAIREDVSVIERYRADPENFETAAPIAQAATIKTISAESETIFKTLRTVSDSRGKKNVDVREQVKTLDGLIKLASTPYEYISIYLMLIPLSFDLSTSTSYLSLEQWQSTGKNINDLFQILEDNRAVYRVLETAEVADDLEVQPKPNAEGIVEILGSVVSFVERLDDEFTKSLQIIDPHTTEYLDRLKDEQLIYNTIIRAQLYSELNIPESEITEKAGDQIARVVARRLEHIYFKPKSLIQIAESKAWETFKQRSYISDADASTDQLLDSLASTLYKQSNAIYRKKAMLSHIYYYAFNNQYYKARDMFLMSHLQSTIHTSDPSLQILFNRALVQLGLSAFRSGLIQDAHQTLQEIATSPRHRELLGQGTQRFSSQTSVIDKQRLLPFHTHINLELLEAVFLTSSLLIEIPQYAQLGTSIDARKRLQNRSFRRTLEFHEKQTFQGPPGNTTDYIMHAAKALQAGDWKKSSELLASLKIWNLFPESENVKNLIRQKIQVEGLRTYLFQFKSFYSKLSITKLSQLFELPESKIFAIVSKMIMNEELAAGLDQVSNSVVFTKGVELTKLQELALSLADKANSLTERNERLVGSQQQQGGYSNNYNSSSNNNQNKNRQHNKNLKFAPATTPGSISGALNGMDKRKRSTHA